MVAMTCSVTADPPEAEKGVHGSGWYPEGSTAKISADSLIEISGYERLKEERMRV